jgi:elongation factor P
MRVKYLTEGQLIKINKDIYKIIEINHSHLGRGKANIEMKLKNILNNITIKKNFNPDEEIEIADFEERPIKFLYSKNNIFHFLDLESNAKLSLNQETLGIKSNFLRKDLDIKGIFIDDNLVNIVLPIKAKFLVVESPPGIKGDSQKSTNKIVTVETGYKLSVPLFIEKDDYILINTETGEYIERVKE